MVRYRRKTIDLVLIIGLFFSSKFSEASELGEVALPDASVPLEQNDSQIQTAVETIAHKYLIEVKSIFKQACFDCHTNLTSYPWYYTLPVVKTKIDRDIAEAREHLDFSNDYPFMSKGTLTEDLEAIAEHLKVDSMPPLPYAVMNRKKLMSSEQKALVLRWIDESLNLLSNAGYVAYNKQ